MMPDRKRLRARRILGAVIGLLLATQVRSAGLVSAQPGTRGPAHVAQATLAPQSLSLGLSGLDSEQPDIAVCADGSVHVVWTEQVPPGGTLAAEDGLDETQIWYRRYDPVAGWNDPEPVVFNSTHQAAMGSEPAIAAADTGDGCVLHLVWRSFWQGNDEIRYTFSDGSGFVTPENVSRLEGQSLMPEIVIMPSGMPHVVWVEQNGYKIYEAWPNPGQNWSKRPINTIGGGLEPVLAVDHDGLLYLAWMEWSLTPHIRYKWQSSPREWEPGEEPIWPSDAPARLPALAVSDGKVGIAWQQATAEGDYDVDFTWRRLGDPGARFEYPANLSASDANSRAPALTVDRSGRFFAAWDEGSPVEAILARRWPGIESPGVEIWWASEQVSGAADDVGEPAIAASADGDHIYAVWAQRDDPDDAFDIYFSELEAKTYHFYLTLISQYDPGGGS